MDRQEQAGGCRVLSRDAIKYIAMFTMLLNHIAQIFMTPGAFWTQVLTDVGYFTAPVMCWFLVEGYGYTRSKKRYGLRLAVFAALSELPFCLAFAKGAALSYSGMNMIFTLLVCFGILEAGEKIRSGLLRRLVQAGLTLLTVLLPSDWPLVGTCLHPAVRLGQRLPRQGQVGLFLGGAPLLVAALDGRRRPAGLAQPGVQPGRHGRGGPGGRGDPLSLQRPARRAWPAFFQVVFLWILPGPPAGAGPAPPGGDVKRRQKSPGTSRAFAVFRLFSGRAVQ